MTKSEFKKIVEKGRKAYVKAEDITQELFIKIEEELGIGKDIISDIPTNSPNADNIEEAICCYMQYGEYDTGSLWEELIGAKQ